MSIILQDSGVLEKPDIGEGSVSCEKLLIQIEEDFEEADWPENHILYGW